MPNPPPQPDLDSPSSSKRWFSGVPWVSQKTLIVLFSSIAISLYGYDQGMMSLVNTNRSYLRTMDISEDSRYVGLIVSVYYVGCIAGAVIASYWADKKGRKPSILACLVMSMVGNLLMFIPGIYPIQSDNTWGGWSRALMLTGRVVLGLGIGGIDATIPVYSSEISKDGARGSALAKEFQANIFGLLAAFLLNWGLTYQLGKDNQWAWRIPIIAMQAFPLFLGLIFFFLPESPRWYMSKNIERVDDARNALIGLHGEVRAEDMLGELQRAQEEESDERIGYGDMVSRHGSQFHPTLITIMGQFNQALTGYGAVSVYGPQIFMLLGMDSGLAEIMTLVNYFLYFAMMTLAWKTIDVLGRRKLMVWGSGGLAICFALLTVMGGISTDFFHEPKLAVEVLGSFILVVATAIFGVCWLATAWLIPTEIYPSGARAQGSAISVIMWGVCNGAVTFLTPLGFNNLKYWLFLVFVGTNSLAGVLTWLFSPETGGRSFEENQKFFTSARESRWFVHEVDGGKFLRMPPKNEDNAAAENADADNEITEDGEDAKDDPSETTLLLPPSASEE